MTNDALNWLLDFGNPACINLICPPNGLGLQWTGCGQAKVHKVKILMGRKVICKLI